MLHAVRGSTMVSAVLIVVVCVDLAVGQRCVDNAENRGRGFFDPDNCNNNCDDGGNIRCCAHDSHFDAYDPLSCPNGWIPVETGSICIRYRGRDFTTYKCCAPPLKCTTTLTTKTTTTTTTTTTTATITTTTTTTTTTSTSTTTTTTTATTTSTTQPARKATQIPNTSPPPKDDLQNATGTNDSGQDGGGTPTPGTGEETEPPSTATPDTSSSDADTGASTDGSASLPDKDGSTPTIVGVVLGCLVLFVGIVAFVYSQNRKRAVRLAGADGSAQGDAANRARFENPTYDETTGTLAGGSKVSAGSLVGTRLDAVPNQIAGGASTYAAVDEAGTSGTDTSESTAADADYETVGAARARAAATGNGLEDENNHYDMQPPGRRRTSSNTSGRRVTSAATSAAARRKSVGGTTQCTRPSPSGGVCKNTAIKATLFCKGHTCPIQGCTNSKSTKMETCPEHVHHPGAGEAGVTRRGNGGGGGRNRPRPESGEVFYDSFGPASGGGNGSGAPQNGGGNAIYAQSTKMTVRSKKQQQQQRGGGAVDANAMYATPMRPVPEQDYVTLNEMPSNDEASVVYDVPTASASDAGAAVPEPTKVGSGSVTVNGASQQHVESDDEEDKIDC